MVGSAVATMVYANAIFNRGVRRERGRGGTDLIERGEERTAHEACEDDGETVLRERFVWRGRHLCLLSIAGESSWTTTTVEGAKASFTGTGAPFESMRAAFPVAQIFSWEGLAAELQEARDAAAAFAMWIAAASILVQSKKHQPSACEFH